MPNGGVSLVTYDTRCTSRVCGRVIYVHSDNTEVMHGYAPQIAKCVFRVGTEGRAHISTASSERDALRQMVNARASRPPDADT